MEDNYVTAPEKKSDGLLPGLVIGISVIGALFFVWRAVTEDSRPAKENPFEYNIEFYTHIDPALLKYTEIRHLPLSFDQLSGIAVNADDRLYVAGDKSVVLLDNEGQIQAEIAADHSPLCLAVDTNGDLYLGMKTHIEVYNREGVKKARWEDVGAQAHLTSIAVTAEHVYAADAGNRIVRKYDKNGDFLLKIGEKDESKDIPGFIVPSPYFDVSVDPDGFLWVVNPGRHSIENYTPEGDLRTSWGETSITIEGFCGCCNPTHIVMLGDGSFVTSEKGIARVKVYNRLGNLESVVAGPDQFAGGTTGLDLASDSQGRIYVLDPVKKAVRIFEKNDPGVYNGE